MNCFFRLNCGLLILLFLAPSSNGQGFDLKKADTEYGAGNYLRAKSLYQQDKPTSETYKWSQYQIASADIQLSNFQVGRDRLQKLVAANPDNVHYLNSLAWFFATVKDKQFRDADKAFKYASKACELTRYRDAASLDNLAAALAEDGNFVTASMTQEQAIRKADPEIIDELKEHALLYKDYKTIEDGYAPQLYGRVRVSNSSDWELDFIVDRYIDKNGKSQSVRQGVSWSIRSGQSGTVSLDGKPFEARQVFFRVNSGFGISPDQDGYVFSAKFEAGGYLQVNLSGNHLPGGNKVQRSAKPAVR